MSLEPLVQYPLGRRVNHDPRSRAYRVAVDGSIQTTRWTRLSPVLDQGNLGSCTGNAGTGVLGTHPYESTVNNLSLDEAYAIALYSDATKIDSDPGTYPPTDTGSDGLSIAKVLKARGLISGYQHAFGIGDAFSAIQQGPLMVGTTWYQEMFRPDVNGVVKVSGQVAGGHEYECIGYDSATDLWEFVNSWGMWGKAGHFFMSTATFTRLLSEQGDIVLLTPITQPAPTPNSPLDANVTILDAWAAARHSGKAAAAAKAWTSVRARYIK